MENTWIQKAARLFAMPLSEVQQIVADDESRFKLVVAGRRWGKSFLAMHEIAKHARQPKQNIFVVFPSYRAAKQILWEPLKEKFLRVNWAKKINESDLSITLVNGSRIYLRSADNIEALRGVSISHLIMDEAALIDKRMWTEICRPALSDQKGGALFITTPKGKGSWIYDLYQGANTQPGWRAFSFTTLEGGNVDPEEIETARNELDEKSFRQEYEASFEQYSGSIYYNWEPTVHITIADKVLNKGEILHCAMDFNVSPLVCAICRVNGNEITVIDEITMEGSNTYEMAEELTNRYPDNRLWIYPDASGKARKTSSNTSDHHILRNAGFTLKVRNINPPVKDRIAAVNASLKSVDGTVKLTVDRSCKNLIRCISSQTYKEGTQIPDKSGNLDHYNDAIGYLTHWINPIRRPVPESNKGVQLFGHY